MSLSIKHYIDKLKNFKINTSSFTELSKSLVNKELILHLNKLLFHLSKKLNKNFIKSRILLSCYTIVHYPKVVLSDSDNKILVNSAKSVLDTYNNFIEGKTTPLIFFDTLNKFKLSFEEWRKNDLLRVLKPYINSYYQLSETLKFVKDSNIWKKEIAKQQNKLKNHIFKIGGNPALKILNEYNPPTVVVDKQFKKQVKGIMRKAYWDIFEQDLKNNNYLLVPILLADLKNMLKKVIPNRNDIHKEIDDKIDVGYIKQLISNSVFSMENCYDLMLYVKNLIKDFEAPEDDKDTDDWWNKIKEKMEGTKYYQFLPLFFKIAFLKIEKIQIVSDYIRTKITI